MNDIEVQSLSDWLRIRWRASLVSVSEIGQTVEAHRRKESFLRRWLPESIVRRLDKGFARSNTVHPETAQALYSIVRAMRPKVLFETGTYWGYSTTYLAAALVDNGEGKIWTFDLYAQAGRHIPESLRGVIEFHRGFPATDSMPAVLKNHCPTIFFQDSVHDYEGVLAELRIVVPYLSKDSVVLFHDFVSEGVRRAAVEGLPGWTVRRFDVGDPQQLGVAWRDC